MKNDFLKKTARFCIWSAVFTGALGTLLHFAFEWLGEPPIAAPFLAVNESTFEHLKLLFWPFFLTTVVGFFIFSGKNTQFIPSAAISVLLGMFSLTALFYTYQGVLGYMVSFINIAIFFVSVIITYYSLYKFMKNSTFEFSGAGFLGSLIFILIITAIICFTFLPPKIGLFLDPTTGGYGL